MAFTQLANNQVVAETKKNLEAKNYQVVIVDSGAQALEKIKKLIPADASVMNGASTTLDQIGYSKYLESGKHKWNDLHAKITAEDDEEKRNTLRRESVLSEYYLGSVHALSSTGDFLIASNTGSQLAHVVFTSQNLIFVVSTKKIVENLDAAFKRLEEHVMPLEDVRLMKQYNVHTEDNKILVIKGENPMKQRTVTFLLVTEDLGF